jgi:hypothetical protein
MKLAAADSVRAASRGAPDRTTHHSATAMTAPPQILRLRRLRGGGGRGVERQVDARGNCCL